MKTAEAAPPPVRGARAWPVSVQAYHALGEAGLVPANTELLYGSIYQKMSKSPYHCFLLTRLLRRLQASIPDGWLLRSEQPLTCADSEPEPDVLLVRGSEARFRREHPQTAELVVEICVSSHDYDRSKLRAYASAGVKEVWLVLGPEKQFEVHWKPVNGRFAERKTYGPGGRVASLSVPGLTLDLATFFAEPES